MNHFEREELPTEQFLPPSRPMMPEKKLMIAILARGIRDYEALRNWIENPRIATRRYGHSFCLSKKRWQEIQDYFFDGAEADHIFSVWCICEYLGMPLDRLQRRIKEGISLPRERFA